MHAVHQGVVISLAKLPRQRFVLGQHRLLVAHAGGDGVEHGHGGIEHGLLLDVGDLDVLLHHEQAVVQFRAAGNDFQQRRLAGAVAADESDALAGFQREIGMVEQRDVAECQLRGREGNDSHGVSGRDDYRFADFRKSVEAVEVVSPAGIEPASKS